MTHPYHVANTQDGSNAIRDLAAKFEPKQNFREEIEEETHPPTPTHWADADADAGEEDEPPLLTLDQKYDRLLQQLGGFGRFQWLAVASLLCGMLSSSWYEYGLTYFELLPNFECQFVPNGPWTACTTDEFCDSGIPYRPTYNTKDDLHNWVETLDLACASDLKVGLLGSSYFMGWAATLLWMPLLADKFGRKIIYRLNMTLNWVTAAFSYYLIQFQLKYFPGNVYVNSMVFSFCGITGYVISGLMYYLRQKLIVFFGYNESAPSWLFPTLVLCSSFGIACTFNLVYVSHPHTFPTLFSATAMGICNFVARIATIFAPLIAELPGSTAMWIFTTLATLSAVFSLFREKRKPELAGSEKKNSSLK